MRIALPFLFAICLPAFCPAQTDSAIVRTPGFYTDKRLDIFIGYHFNLMKRDKGDTSARKYHLLEIGLLRTKFLVTRHWGGLGYYMSSEIGLNTKEWLIGPKIGGFLAYGPLILGSELVLYTDFEEESLRWVPFFGFGSNRLQITVNPHVVLSNKDFFGRRFGLGALSARYALIGLKREKIIWR